MRLAIILALLAGPVMAEDRVCTGIWNAVTGSGLPITGLVVGVEDGWCVIRDVVLNLPGVYVPDWHADKLRLQGSALPWVLGDAVVPEALEAEVSGLRLVVQTDMPQMDYLFAAQSRAAPIQVALAVRWDKAAKVLHLDRLDIDFPGNNAVTLTAVAGNVDLSSIGAAQMALTGFSITNARLSVTTHGLFEAYALMALGSALLPDDGDMDAAVANLKVEAAVAISALPGQSFSDKTKGAMWALVQEMPNPSGMLTVDLRADPGFGPARLGGFAVTGMPATMDQAAPLFEGVVVDVVWTHDEDR